MHSDLYRRALKADLIEFIQPSGRFHAPADYRGLAVISDDGMPLVGGVYTCGIVPASKAVGYGLSAPSIAAGTEVENKPSAGNGGGQQVLHSRVNLAIHPLGLPVGRRHPGWRVANHCRAWWAPVTLARVVDRKATPLAFLKCK